MNGREENNIKNEAKTMKMIADYPLLQEYYFSKDENSAKGKFIYCAHIINYFKYLTENGIDIFKIDSFKRIKMIDINKYMASIRYYTDKNGNKKQAAASSRNVKLAAIRSFYNFLVKAGYIQNNPCDNVENPKIKIEKEIVYLEKDEIEKIKEEIDADTSYQYLEWMKVRDKLIITLDCRTGLRKTALSEINISDIDFDNNKILVTEKGNITREVYFGEDTKKLIIEWLSYREKVMKDSDCDALFISKRKSRISTVTIDQMIVKYSSKIGKRISSHKMRATCATNLYEQTHDIYIVKDVLGHKNVANTQRYANVSEKKKKQAAAILDEL